MGSKRRLAFGLGLTFAAVAGAQQTPAPASAARIAELQARIAQLTQQLELLRGGGPPEARWTPPGSLVPASPLQRASAVATIDAGCPPGAVCLVVRCDALHAR